METIPILRAGEPYESLSSFELPDMRTGEPVVRVSQANPGLVTRDMARSERARRALDEVPVAELIEISGRAAKIFLEGEVPLGASVQGPDEYVRHLSATTGLPETLARANMAKSGYVLAEMETVLGGLTRGLDLEILDRGYGVQHGRALSYRRETDVLGAILPSNSPGVHSLWIPAIPLKVGLALKPGRAEPWTPWRILQALRASGCPPEALGFYPTDYSGAGQILLGAGRSLLFGDRSTVEPWESDDRVQIHGPGWSKVVFGEDAAADWEPHIDLVAASVADNGGRSCINASGVRVPKNGREIALGLAERLAAIEARPLDHPEARLAAFPSRAAAEAVSAYIDARLGDGAEDLTARFREGGRVAEAGGAHYVLPTVVWCDDAEHPLAQTELLFPFVSVVEVPRDELVAGMGPSLVVSALTEDPALRRELLDATWVERLNLGAIPTSKVSWDQPHEGNLFEHLYRQRALYAPEVTPAATGATDAAPGT